MSKLQAHMALAAISQQQNKLNKMKIAQQHRPSSGSASSSNEFSPPSQIISNYANYETATRVPLWHHGFPSKNLGVGAPHTAHSHKNEATQLIMPSVHPSIITPFIEQVQLKAKEAEQKQTFKYSHESNSESSESNGSHEVINDVFSQDLVPPPSSSKHRYKTEKPKFNLSMKSPLQDASRFNYENVISTATPGSTSATHHENIKFRPIPSEQSASSGEKPNVFVNLNRPKDNVYKHHKQLHPSYTGGPKKKLAFGQQQEKPPHFLPTPFEASKEVEEIKIDYGQPQHSFFTIEDAVTPHFVDNVKHQNEYNDEFEIITLRPQVKPTYASFTAGPSLFSTSTTPHITPTPQTETVPSPSPRPKGKLRRRKPKPHLQQQSSQKVPSIKEVSSEETSTSTTYRPPTAPAHLTGVRTRGNIKSNNSSSTHENELKTRNRLNHPNRVRTRPNFTAPSATLPTAADYDFTINPIEAERKSEVSSTQDPLEGATSTKSSEQQPDIVKHRVRLRYKNKLNVKNALDTKLSGDNQISDSENENVVVVRQPTGEEASEFTVATESPFNEIKSSLKLPNLKLRNEAVTTLTLPTAESHTVSSTSASNEHDENVGSNVLNKIARPRFSIKELKRKQFLTSSTAPGGNSLSTTVLTSSTSSTTPRPDNQRFNRYRLNLHRRRNETNIELTSGEQVESEQPSTRRRYSSTRFSVSTSTTESTLTPSPSSSKRGNTLPKRTYPVRNFTRPSSSDNGETSTSHKPAFISKSSTNRPSVPSLRQRIQNYKRKEAANDIIGEESIKNVNFEAETTVLHVEPTVTTSSTISTELPITRETSIMKIAKTSQSSQSVRATTSNSIVEDTLQPSSSSTTLTERHDATDLVGSPSEHSQRVAELTVSANENSTFKSANIGLLSRRIPNYFTISTDDPILPIQAFFPQIKTNEGESLVRR